MTEIELYESHEKLMKMKAWSFHKSFGIPIEELVSETNIIFVTTLKLYDETKSKFTTFLYIRLDQGLLQFVQEWRKQLPSFYEGSELVENSLQHSYCIDWIEEFWGKVAMLSEEAAIVVTCITDGPEEIYQIIQTKPPKMVRGAVIKYLRKEKQWSWPKIWHVFRAIKQWIRKGGEDGYEK